MQARSLIALALFTISPAALSADPVIVSTPAASAQDPGMASESLLAATPAVPAGAVTPAEARDMHSAMWRADNPVKDRSNGLWLSTRNDMKEIGFRESNLKLSHARAQVLRREIRSIRRRYGLHNAADADRLSPGRQRELSEELSVEEERIWQDSSGQGGRSN
jgi:hypothetical protein